MSAINPKWRRGLDSAVDTTDISNGNILLTTDSGRLFIDIDGSRIEVSDFVKKTEADILATITPLPKIYFATDTGKFYYYNNGWKACNSDVAAAIKATSAATTKAYVLGVTGDESTPIYDPNVYLDTTSGAFHATTFNGYKLASACAKTAGSASGNVPINGAALGTTANVPVVTNASGQLIPHASGALGTAAFKAATAFDTAGSASAVQTALDSYIESNDAALAAVKTTADSAVQSVAKGTSNGTISVDGTNVSVYGLGSAAYKTAGSALGNVPVIGAALGTTANVPVVINTSGQLIPHASGALGTAAFTASSAYATASHTHSAASSTAAGFMSADDKAKLDNIASGANAYTLPTATSSVLGGVKIGSNITIASGVISLSKSNVVAALGYTPPTTNTTYSVMTGATSSAAGASGLVPAPAAGNQALFLRGDGTWATPPDTNTTYSNMTAATASAAGKAGLVPAPAAGSQAKFLRGDGTWATPTNTTYGVASTTANGLMSSGDKTNLDGLVDGTVAAAVATKVGTTTVGGTTKPIYLNSGVPTACSYTLGTSVPSNAVFTDESNVGYGACSTAAATAAKVVTLSSNDKFALVPGAVVTVKFTYTNTASNPTLNVNGTGAKSIWFNTAAITTSNLSYAGYASRYITYVYDGTYWVFRSWGYDANTTTQSGSADTSNKIFLIGTTAQSSSGQTTYSHDTAYVGTDGHVYSNGIQTVNLSDAQALTNKTYEGYTLGKACSYSVADSSAAGAISSTGTDLVTERDVYYGLPTINNSHAYTSSTTIYAPTAGGTSGYVLVGAGTTSAPTWNAPATFLPKLGFGYVTCSTAAATVAKIGTCSNYVLVTGGLVAVKFTYSVPAGATLNINSKGAKAIYCNGAAITADTITAGAIALMVYDGSYYQVIAVNTMADGDFLEVE